MSKLIWLGNLIVLGLSLPFTVGSLVYIKTPSRVPGAGQKEASVTIARGTFVVKVKPQASANDGVDRMSIDKQFQGDLQGSSKVEMLAVSTNVKNSAGYVAMEIVTGTLNGRTGTFALQHSGTMSRGTPQLSVTVVPDSGTGELKGLSGRMSIEIAEGKHSYEFEYSIAVAAP